MPHHTKTNALKALPLAYLFAIQASAQTIDAPNPDIVDAYDATNTVEEFSSANGKTAVSYKDSAEPIIVELSKGTGEGGYASGDTFEGITTIIGPDIEGYKGYNVIKGDDQPNGLYGSNISKNTFEGKGGPDTIVGSPYGWNWAIYTSSSEGVSINLETNQNFGGDAEGDLLFNIDAIRGSYHSDYLRGSNNDEYLVGKKGQDVFDPQGGDDISVGDRDNDLYIYTSGHDAITESTHTDSTNDTVAFDSIYNPQRTYVNDNEITFADHDGSIKFNDITLIENFAFSGYPNLTLDDLKNIIEIAPDPFYENSETASEEAKHYDTQDGSEETVSYAFSSQPINVSLESGRGFQNDSAGDTYSGVLNIIGADSPKGDGYNTITGNDLPNRLYGTGESRNRFQGLGGADIIVGSPNGWNWAKYDRSPEGVNINMDTNINTGGHAQGDLLYNIDAVGGSDFSDSFTGTHNNELFDGGAGIDKAYYDGELIDYNITIEGNITKVEDTRSPSINGYDILTDVEEVHFEDGILRDGEFQLGTNFSLTLQASNIAGRSGPSNPVVVKNPSPEKDLNLSFTAPDRLESGACVQDAPVTNYHLNVSALNDNNTVAETNTFTFSVDDPDLHCVDNLDDFDEQCDVYRQECSITFEGTTEPAFGYD